MTRDAVAGSANAMESHSFREMLCGDSILDCGAVAVASIFPVSAIGSGPKKDRHNEHG